MVRAILEGKKTQTRRILKIQPHPEAELRSIIPRPNAVGSCVSFAHVDGRGIHSHSLTLYCPYGMPGDRLWVRETWGLFNDLGFCDTSLVGLKQLPRPWQLAYRTDHVDPVNGDGPHRPYWRPSIFMPRWASRITLEITGVRVERLQQVSEADARAEGAIGALNSSVGNNWCAREAFAALWESIHGTDSWDVNSWVWVVEFRRLETARQEVAP